MTHAPTTNASKATEIAEVSAEGPPAHPRISSHGIVLRFAAVLAITIAASLVIGFFFGVPGAIIAAIAIIALAAIFNPELWSVPSRMKDRRKANDSDPAAR